MTAFLAALLDVAVVVFAASSMLSVGLAYTFADIVGPLRNVWGVLRALVANFVLVPLLALLVVSLLVPNEAFAAGLVIVGVAAGAPFLIKLTELADADLSLGATALVLLLPLTVIVMPIAVPFLIPGAWVNPAAIAVPLAVTMLLPLALGLAIRVRWPQLAARVRPWLGRVSTVALLALIAATLVVAFEPLRAILGQGVILPALLVVAGAFGIGYLAGGRDPDVREVLGLATGQRNIAAATVVATQSIDDPDTLAMVVATSLVGFAVLFPIAGVLRKHERRRHERS